MIDEIGGDADLLTRSDEWLDIHRKYLSGRMSELAEELDAVLTAQKYKNVLQSNNLIAIPAKSGPGTLAGSCVTIVPTGIIE
jgi:hypothetical protein